MDTSIGGFVKNCWDDEEDLAFAKPEPKVATAATKVSVVSGGKPKKSAAKKATTAPPKGGPISGEEKRKREELVQKADYEVAQDLFDSIDDGPRPSTAAEKPPIDPKTEFEFEAFAFHLAQMVTPLSTRFYYRALVKSLLRQITSPLTVEDMKEIGASVNVMVNDKIKAAKGKPKKGKAVSNPKKSLNIADDDGGHDTDGDDENQAESPM